MARFAMLLLPLAMLLALPAAASAGYKEDFEKEFMSKAWYGEQIEHNTCIECHASDNMEERYRIEIDSWNASWHPQNGISCEHCHGGDPKDASLAMSRQRGFTGTPKSADVPGFCGKCHVAILANFQESGHGKALKAGKKAPNCVTCHSAHATRQASIDIISEPLCTKCHSYDRAKIIKQALFHTEKRFTELDQQLRDLKRRGLYTEQMEKRLFNTEAEFRTLFHTVDAALVTKRTDEFASRLDAIDKQVLALQAELGSRRNYAAYLMFAFSGMGIVIFLLSRMPDE